MTGYEPRDIHSTDYIFCNLQTSVEWISGKKNLIPFEIGVPFNIVIQLADYHLFDVRGCVHRSINHIEITNKVHLFTRIYYSNVY